MDADHPSTAVKIARRITGTLIPLLRDVPSIEYVTYALWPQTPHLPLRVRFDRCCPTNCEIEAVLDQVHRPVAEGKLQF